MAELTVTPITKDGLDVSSSLVAADAAGDTVGSSSGLMFVVANGDASPKTVTVTAPVSSTICGGYGSLPVSDITIAIPAGETRHFTIPSGYAANSLFTVNYDDVTSVTTGVFSLS